MYIDILTKELHKYMLESSKYKSEKYILHNEMGKIVDQDQQNLTMGGKLQY